MLDLAKIPWTVLEAVRQNRGVPAEDSRADDEISNLSGRELLARYATWFLGDSAWGRNFYDLTHAVDNAETGTVTITLHERDGLGLRRALQLAEDYLQAEEKHESTLKRPPRDVTLRVRAEQREGWAKLHEALTAQGVPQ